MNLRLLLPNLNENEFRALYRLISEEVIGGDVEFKCWAGYRCDGDMCCDGEALRNAYQNNLRAEQREKLGQLCGFATPEEAKSE